MPLDANAVTKIARLSRIAVSDAEKEHIAKEISDIIQWIEQLNEVDTDNAPQMVSVADIRLPWRKDEVNDGDQAAEVVKNAPSTDYDCFVVPKVIE